MASSAAKGPSWMVIRSVMTWKALMDLGLRGKTALVLGAGGGLGRAIAKALAGEGRGLPWVIEMPSILSLPWGHRCRGLGRPAAGLGSGRLSLIDGHVASIERQFGPVEVLINNTGGPPPAASGRL